MTTPQILGLFFVLAVAIVAMCVAWSKLRRDSDHGKNARKEGDSVDDPAVDSNFQAFLSWASEWSLLRPKVIRFSPTSVARYIADFIEIANSNSSRAPVFHRVHDAGSQSLILFYLERLTPAMRQFDQTTPDKAQMQSLLHAATEVGSAILIMDALVQILFWQFWLCQTKLRSDLNVKQAMSPFLSSFLKGAEILEEKVNGSKR